MYVCLHKYTLKKKNPNIYTLGLWIISCGWDSYINPTPSPKIWGTRQKKWAERM